MVKKIGILTFYSFPEGMAPTTRILAYSKGFISNKIDVEIFSFRRIFKDQKTDENIIKSGVLDGIKYTYIHFFNNLGKKYRIFRILDELILRVKLIFMVLTSNRINKFDCFIFSFDDLNHLPFYTSIFKIFNFPVFLIADEFPIPIRDFLKDSIPKEMILKYRKYNNFFSGRILMSQALQKFYDNNISKKPTFILNTIIDFDRFINLNKYTVEKKYICYMGNMALSKDNIDNIIEAFALIANKNTDIDLHLYGTPNENDKKIISDLITKLNLKNRIFLKGRASYNQVPFILSSAKILVNSQPKTKRAEGGFPTKLGEYLLSGVPSVFTDSGDIIKVVKNETHAFIVKPEDVQEYARVLSKILDNYEKAEKIGKNGRDFMFDKFDTKVTTGNLIKFMSKFIKN